MGMSFDRKLSIVALAVATIAAIAAVVSVPALQRFFQPTDAATSVAPNVGATIKPVPPAKSISGHASTVISKLRSVEMPLSDNGGCQPASGQIKVVVLRDRSNFSATSLLALQRQLPCSKFRVRWGKTLMPGKPLNFVFWTDPSITAADTKQVTDALQTLGIEPRWVTAGVDPRVGAGVIWLAYGEADTAQ